MTTKKSILVLRYRSEPGQMFTWSKYKLIRWYDNFKFIIESNHGIKPQFTSPKGRSKTHLQNFSPKCANEPLHAISPINHTHLLKPNRYCKFAANHRANYPTHFSPILTSWGEHHRWQVIPKPVKYCTRMCSVWEQGCRVWCGVRYATVFCSNILKVQTWNLHVCVASASNIITSNNNIP